MVQTEAKKGRPRRERDLRYLMLYQMPDLEKVLGFCRKTIQKMIDERKFPAGKERHTGAQKTWDRRIVERWVSSGMAGLE